MLNKIIVSDDYSGTLIEENAILEQINKNFTTLEEKIFDLPQDSMKFEQHIIDFEEYEIDIYFEANLKKATISVNDSYIEVQIGEKIVRISADGDVI